MIFVIRVPHITATHCMLYCYALAVKSLPEKLENVRSNNLRVEAVARERFFEQGGGPENIKHKFCFALKLPITCIIQ